MPTKRSSSRSSRPSRRSKRSWSSSVIGSHAASHASEGRSYSKRPNKRAKISGRTRPSVRGAASAQPSKRRSPASINKRSAEINQMEVPTRSVDQRTSQHAGSRSRAQEFMKRRRRNTILMTIGVILVIGVLLFTVGSCAFRMFASATMALNDVSVQDELVATEDGQPYYVLLAGFSDLDTRNQAASYISVLRIDEQNAQFSLMNIPNNIKVSFGDDGQDLLRNAPRHGGDAALVRAVKDQTDIDFAHYLRITEEGLKKLVDDIGGVEVNVEYRVDDPRVGHVVIAPGEQNLNGEQAVAFVSATNFIEGRTQRMNNQMEFFFALMNKMTSSEGLGWINDSDVVANAIKTDMSYDALSHLATLYSEGASFYTATMPGSQYSQNNVICFAPNSKTWQQVRERFMAGENPNESIDTSGVQKDQLTIVVRNGSGTDGFAAQAAQVLESHGYKIQDTGNADSFVYTETLVIYKDRDDEAAAEAIVADLGVGRAVYASVYYNLKTDIQVVVGQDWKPIA